MNIISYSVTSIDGSNAVVTAAVYLLMGLQQIEYNYTIMIDMM